MRCELVLMRRATARYRGPGSWARPAAWLVLWSTLLLVGCPAVRAPGVGAPVAWSELPGWHDDRLAEAWPALMNTCEKMPARDGRWRLICNDAAAVTSPDDATARAFFETRFEPREVGNQSGGADGLITGYYEPLLNGSRVRTSRFRYPLYGVPDDLLTVDLGELFPELKGRRVRGRLDGRRVVPYFSRPEIKTKEAALTKHVLLWVDDPVALFFLEIQGSGRVQLASGETVFVGYADQNGHPYVPIGRQLLRTGVFAPGEASMQAIRAWLRANPDRAPALLNSNPSYVFFNVRDPQLPGPLGALSVPLLPERAIAVDPAFIPLGAPVWLDTFIPGDTTPYRRLVFALDTGGAIKGPVRADLFFGHGQSAEERAGAMNAQGRLYVLVPAMRAAPK